MNNVNEHVIIKLIKNFIQDLSFENPQSINDNNPVNNNNSNIDINMNIIFKPYENNLFSLNIKYNLDCSLKQNKMKLCNLELDYFGFFEILDEKIRDQKLLTEAGTKLLFPFVKEVIEDLTRKGGNVPILLNEVDFDLRKI